MDGSRFDELSRQLAKAGSRRALFKTLLAGLVVTPLFRHFGRDESLQASSPFKCPPGFPCGSGWCCESSVTERPFCIGRPGKGSTCCSSSTGGDFWCDPGFTCGPSGCVKKNS